MGAKKRAAVRAVLLALPILLPACVVSAYRDLRPEADLEEYARLHRTFLSRKHEPRRIPTADREGRIVGIAVHEVGAGDRERAIVLIHGVLSDHETFRYLAGALRAENDILLVELPGCGDSDKPDPDDLGPDGYGVTAMARRIFQALRAVLEARPRPTRLALAGHSLGGTIAVRMVADPGLRAEYADVIAHIDRLILMAPIDVAIEKQHPTFEYFEGVGDITVWLADLTGILRHRVSLAHAESTSVPRSLPREEADRFIRNVCDGPRRHASQAMVKQAIPRRDGLHPDWRRIEELAAQYESIRIPTLILWGAWDETFPLSMGYKLQVEIPNAVLRIIPETKHSPQLERPRVCARSIEAFLRDGDGAGPRIARITATDMEELPPPVFDGAR